MTLERWDKNMCVCVCLFRSCLPTHPLWSQRSWQTLHTPHCWCFPGPTPALARSSLQPPVPVQDDRNLLCQGCTPSLVKTAQWNLCFRKLKRGHGVLIKLWAQEQYDYECCQSCFTIRVKADCVMLSPGKLHPGRFQVLERGKCHWEIAGLDGFRAWREMYKK